MLLNDTIPFLSEGMEDENQEVEIVAKSIVARIEQLTGDSIQDYLKWWINEIKNSKLISFKSIITY